MIKKLLFFLFFLTIFQTLQAQSDHGFAPNGAKWYYTIFPFNFLDPYSYVEYECIGDTLLNGKITSIIMRNFGMDDSNLENPHFLHYDSNQVFWYNHYSGDFNLLYDFNKNIGESWDIILPCDTAWPSNPSFGGDTLTVHVTDTSKILVNGVILKQLETQELGPIIEGIGRIFQGYPSAYNFCGNGVSESPGGMRCYEDSLLGLYKGPDYRENRACNAIYYDVALAKNTNVNVELYPNPSSKKVVISIRNSIQFDYSLSNMEGQLLKESPSQSKYFELDVSDISNGMYLLKVYNNSFQIMRKLHIQH